MGSALTPGRSPRASAALAGGLIGAAAMIAVVTVASRVAGFARTVVQAREVGATELGNAYSTANILPNVVFEVAAGGALAGAVVPLLALPLSRALRRDVDRISSALLGWALLVLVPLAALVAVLARPLARLLVQDGGAAQVDLAASFLVVFALQVPLYGVGVVLTGVLQAHRRFLAPALAPLLSSLVVIAVYVVFGALVADPADPDALPGGAFALLAWGTTAGVAAMSLPLLWPVRRCGVRLRPTLHFPPGVAGRARALAWAGLGGLLAQQLSVVVGVLMVNRHGQASLPVLQSLQAVYFLPYAVLAVPLATATFPRLAERAAERDRQGFATMCSSTTRLVLVVGASGAAVLVAAAPAVEQFFQVFGTGDFSGMGDGLAWTAPGLLGFALLFHLTRALYALERGRLAVTAAASGWAAVAVVAAVAVPWWTGGGQDQAAALSALGVANTVGMTVAGVALIAGVARAAGRDAVRGVARTAVLLLLGGTVGVLLGRLVAGAVLDLPSAGTGGAVAVGVVAGAVAGGALATSVVLGDRTVLRTLGRVARAARTDDAPDGRTRTDGGSTDDRRQR